MRKVSQPVANPKKSAMPPWVWILITCAALLSRLATRDMFPSNPKSNFAPQQPAFKMDQGFWKENRDAAKQLFDEAARNKQLPPNKDQPADAPKDKKNSP